MKKKILTPETLFFIVSLLGIAVMFILLMLSRGWVLHVMGYGESFFCDFWEHIARLYRGGGGIYADLSDADAIFPPLAYCFLQMFAQCLRHYDNDIVLATTGYGILIFGMYLLIFMTAFTIMLNYAYKTENAIKKAVIPFIFLFSYPFWGCAFGQGNPVIYAMLFLFIGMSMRNHENSVIRELAMVSVAVAAGFKLYPALFGLLWIREKRYKESFRLLIYGLVAFFVPFAFFGGIEGVFNYVGTFLRYVGKDIYSTTSILGTCIMLFGEQGKIIGRIVIVIWLLWVVAYLFTEGITWKSIVMMTSTHTILLAESYVYTYVYIVIPCICFLNSINGRQDIKKMDYIYAMLFALVFTLPPFINRQSGVIVGLYLCWMAMLVLISAERVIDMRYRLLGNNINKQNDY